MSKGTRKYPIRIPDDIAREINLAIDSRNFHSRESGWTFSDWIRKAIREKLAHTKRSRSKKAAEKSSDDGAGEGVQS